MIHLYQSPEELNSMPGEKGRCCLFEGEDAALPEMLRDTPQALALLHLLIEGYLACKDDERDTYWREATENTVQWMAKKGIIELV